MKKVLYLVVLFGLLLTACGAKAPPTPDAAQVQASAVSMAFTMSAQTMAAQPTATPIPPTLEPTFAPPPSPTFPVLPTFPAIQPTATKAVSGDACSNALVDMGASGPKVFLMVINKTKASVTFSLYLSETPFACGFVPGVNPLAPHARLALSIPEGCYYPFAMVNDPKKAATNGGPARCIHGDDKIELQIDYTNNTWLFP